MASGGSHELVTVGTIVAKYKGDPNRLPAEEIVVVYIVEVFSSLCVSTGMSA
jgi:hypothetical protein